MKRTKIINDDEVVKLVETKAKAMCEVCCIDELISCERCLFSYVKRLVIVHNRLKEGYSVYEETTGLKQAKAEAIKEFAERLKAEAMLQHDGVTVVYGSNIDNLVKEMTERNHEA